MGMRTEMSMQMSLGKVIGLSGHRYPLNGYLSGSKDPSQREDNGEVVNICTFLETLFAFVQC